MDLDDAVDIRHPPLDLTKTFVHVTREPGVLSLNWEFVTLTKTSPHKLLPSCVLSHPQNLSLNHKPINIKFEFEVVADFILKICFVVGFCLKVIKT